MHAALNTPAMQNVTVRLPLRLLAELEREADQHGVSRSEYIRDTLATRDEHERTQRECDRLRAEYEREIAALKQTHEEEIAALEQQVADERNRADELREMLKAANRRNEETEALVAYVEAQQGVVGRAKTWLFGRE